MMTIQDELSFGKGFLEFLEVELLLSSVLKTSRAHIFAHSEEEVSLDASRVFRGLLSRRRDGIPVAYLLQNREFYGLDFYVDERCLIPRPETELVVDLALKAALGCEGKILDIGTGSGAIVVALAKHLPSVQFVASDISEKALEVAKKNVDKHGFSHHISLVQSDLLENFLPPCESQDFCGIVANLPYIPESDKATLGPGVAEYEPSIALFGGDDGLRLFDRLFAEILQLPKLPKFLIGEFGFGQEKMLRAMLEKAFTGRGMVSLEFFNDLAGIPRAFIVKFV